MFNSSWILFPKKKKIKKKSEHKVLLFFIVIVIVTTIIIVIVVVSCFFFLPNLSFYKLELHDINLLLWCAGYPMFHLYRINEEKFDSVRQRVERAKPIANISKELQSYCKKKKGFL